MNRPRVLLADDHTLVMQGIRSLLLNHVDLVGMYEDGLQLVENATLLKPDVILLDISMPVMNGMEAARRLRQDVPEAKLIFLTQYADDIYVEEALRIGVSGYLLKRSAVSELVAAIDAVLAGKTYLSPVLHPQPKSADGSHTNGKGDDLLTQREREVLQLAAEGRSAKQIASALKISVKTVQFHKANLTQKLGLHTTAELVKYAMRRGLTAP
jgi:DNA-binding NarL/FixJ family response regulator